MIRLSRIPLRLTSFWPLLLLVVVVGVVVWYLSPANLKIVPYKLLIVLAAMYLAHRYDERAFGKLGEHIVSFLQGMARAGREPGIAGSDDGVNTATAIGLMANALLSVARAIVFLGIVYGLAIAL